MKSKKITSMLLAAILLLSTSITASATEGMVEPHSISINGVTTVDKSPSIKNEFLTNDIKNLQPKLSSTKPGEYVASSGWEYDGMVPGSITSVKTTFNNFSKLFYNHSVTIPKGCNYTFEWFQTIQNSNDTTKAIELGVRAQGGFKFLAEVEGHIKGSYAKTQTVTIQSGVKSTVGVLGVQVVMEQKTAIRMLNCGNS